MLRGLYTASSGMVTQSKIMDVVSNNLANVNTTGYKRDTVVTSAFPDFTVTKNGGDNIPYDGKIGKMNYGILVDTLHTNFQYGTINETKGKLDFALEGNGFFAVSPSPLSTPQNIRYTRDGSFSLNKEGYLVTKDGYYVLSKNTDQSGNHVAIKLTQGDISVDGSGNISLNGQYMDRFNIVDFNNYNILKKEGENLFDAAGAQIIPANAVVKQGYLESSNVNSVDEMVNMINVVRSYEANQKVVTAFDETLSKTVNDVGRV
ncbi:MAG: flagellar hook-basal body complex protein [Thermoanaerobacteraceae bacterium]|nr:flagellar hook-basal body complex protein [Thermoanaerobacteraceae bacterium]